MSLKEEDLDEKEKLEKESIALLEKEFFKIRLSELNNLPLSAEDFYNLPENLKSVFIDYAYRIITTLGIEEDNRKGMIEKLKLEVFRLQSLENGGFPSEIEEYPKIPRDDKDLLLEFTYYYAQKEIILNCLSAYEFGNLVRFFITERIGIRLKPKMRDDLKRMIYKSKKWRER